MEELEKFIDSNYSKLPFTKVLDIAQEQCNYLMLSTNSQLQSNLHFWSDEKLKDATFKIQCYANLITFIISVKNNDSNHLSVTAKQDISNLMLLIRKETELDFLNFNLKAQQEMIEQLYIPHLLIKWVVTKSTLI